MLFFSRNLEHSLYGKANCTNDEKKFLSNKFEEDYKDDADKFYKYLKECKFDVPDDYMKSWEYIMNKSNSCKRGENYFILLDILKKYNK